MPPTKRRQPQRLSPLGELLVLLRKPTNYATERTVSRRRLRGFHRMHPGSKLPFTDAHRQAARAKTAAARRDNRKRLAR